MTPTKWCVLCALPCHGEIPLTKAPTSFSICFTDTSSPMTPLLTIASMRSRLCRQLWPCPSLKIDTIFIGLSSQSGHAAFLKNRTVYCSCLSLDPVICQLVSSLPEDLGHNTVCLKSPTACKITLSWAHIRAHFYEYSSVKSHWKKFKDKIVITEFNSLKNVKILRKYATCSHTVLRSAYTWGSVFGNTSYSNGSMSVVIMVSLLTAEVRGLNSPQSFPNIRMQIISSTYPSDCT